MNYDDVLLTAEQSKMLKTIYNLINDFANLVASGEDKLDKVTQYIQKNAFELEEFLDPDTINLIPVMVSSYNTYIDTMWRQYDRFENNEM